MKIEKVTVLTMPFGPRLVRTASAIARAAVMFDWRTDLPRVFCSLDSLDAMASGAGGEGGGGERRRRRVPLGSKLRAKAGWSGRRCLEGGGVAELLLPRRRRQVRNNSAAGRPPPTARRNNTTVGTRRTYSRTVAT
eukprot:SAG31_NODE_441_length_15661_cov_17.905423_17_plen_136_part_00